MFRIFNVKFHTLVYKRLVKGLLKHPFFFFYQEKHYTKLCLVGNLVC